ncbi:MAG: zf-HC2 domain-containing protein [Granulosicoccus sp.]|nr:zf-HC2 domain-containing protein [Granulosicoccus sp.]
MTNKEKFTQKHNQVIELLPWWVNKTLNDHENEMVERHISNCDECQAEIEMLSVLNNEIASSSVADYAHHADVDQSLSSVMQRIDNTPDEEKVSSSNPGLIQSFLQTASTLLFPRSTLQWAGSAIACVVVVLTGMQLWNANTVTDNEYQVLSTAEPQNSAVRLSVRFTESVTAEHARKIVGNRAVSAGDSYELVGSEDEGFSLLFPATVTVNELNNTIIELQNDPAVENVAIVPNE